MKKTITLSLIAVTTALAMAAGGLKFEARLQGAGKGKAKWTVKGTGESQAELQVEAERLRPDTDYFVTIGNEMPWSVHTTALGTLRLTQRYVGVKRPTIGAGTIVIVSNANSETILTGAMVQR